MTKHILVHKKSKKLAVGIKAKQMDGKKVKKTVFLVFDNLKFKDKAEEFKTLTEAKKKYSIYKP